MTLQIADSETRNGSIVLATVNPNSSVDSLIINRDEQVRLLETLARMLDYTLVDREERKSLLALTAEVDQEGGHTGDGWVRLAEALAAAVSSALRFENDKEV